MLFTYDTEFSLQAAAALVNTGGAYDGERLPDVAALTEFIRTWGWTGRLQGDQAELDSVRALRPRLLRLWQVDEDEAADIVNALLREGQALPQLVKHDSWDYHLHATSPDAPLADRMMVEAAMAISEVIRAKELGRFHFCASDDCDDVLVDLSKNRSRRFCSIGCANRTNVAAFRARKAKAAN